MTPDKIYVHEISAEELTKNLPYHICYIRRDALLEWAKEWQKELPEGLGASMVHHVLNEVIDKIESL